MTQPAARSTNTHAQSPEKRRQTQIERNRALIALLDAWEQEDAQEQRDTLNILARTLDEDRMSSRPLFAQ